MRNGTSDERDDWPRSTKRARLGGRCQARARQQPATEAVIVVAVAESTFLSCRKPSSDVRLSHAAGRYLSRGDCPLLAGQYVPFQEQV